MTSVDAPQATETPPPPSPPPSGHRLKPLRATYLKASPGMAHCPETTPPEGGALIWEVAFVGRSNVGKSSLINALLGVKKLAKTSNTPGKTRLLQFYDLEARRTDTGQNVHIRLVDLPGYGYAKVSATEQAAWRRDMSRYLAERDVLRLIVQVVDARHGVKPNDRQMLDWILTTRHVPHLALNKADLLKQGERLKVRQQASKDAGMPLSRIHLLSAKTPQTQSPLWEAMWQACYGAD